MRFTAHVINSLNPEHGGTSVSVPSLARATAKSGRYRNVLIEDRGNYLNGNLGQNTMVVTENFSPFRIVRDAVSDRGIPELIRNVDAVHIHGLWTRHCAVTGILASLYRKPTVISAHGMLEKWALRNKAWKKAPYSFLFERPNMRRAALLRALTRAEAEDYRRFGLKNRIVIIPNGVDPPDDVSPNLALDCWPELRNRKIVLFLSRIHYKKGVDLLVTAWAKTAQQFPDAHLVIAGPDSEGTKAAVDRLIKENSIGDRVTFTGAVFDKIKASLFKCASLFILPSYSEGFSIAALEALASGVPIIITKECHFSELNDIDAGWIISPNVSEVGASLHEALSTSTECLQARGKKGRDYVLMNYSWSSVGSKMADAFDWVLGGDRPSSMEIWE